MVLLIDAGDALQVRVEASVCEGKISVCVCFAEASGETPKELNFGFVAGLGRDLSDTFP